MIKKNDIIRLDISAVTNEGFGVGRYSDAELRNFVVYVPYTAVGDTIDCRVVKKLSSYAFGKIESIIIPSPQRISDADCAAFGKCGGCVYRHISYEAELFYKKQAVEYAYRTAFSNTLPMPEILDTESSPEVTGYRNKVEYPVADGKCAFYAPKSHRAVQVENCPLQHKSFAPVVKSFEEYIKESKASCYDENTGKGQIRHLFLRANKDGSNICACVVATDANIPKKELLVSKLSGASGVVSVYLNENPERTNVILGKKFTLLFGEKYIEDELCGIKMQISPQSFYQVNRAQAERLYGYALTLADGAENLLDLYCGIGGIALAAAKKAKRVVGVEIVPEAIADAKRIAAANGIENAEFYTSDANKLFEVLRTANFTPDTVMVDPPRKGLDEATVNALCAILPKRIVYISCNPATQAKNVRDIAEKTNGAYTLSAVAPFDMFPRTAHVETVVLMSLVEHGI